jgi:hypothetical protein
MDRRYGPAGCGKGGKDFARRSRKGIGADKSASDATRVAGTTNYKAKYVPDYPTVCILGAHSGRIVSKEQLEGTSVRRAGRPRSSRRSRSGHRRSPGRRRAPEGRKSRPDYAPSLAGASPNRKGTGPDRSMADFT